MIRAQVLEAIVLSQKDFGEADRILILFSKQKGKVTVLAKGVRRITSRRGGNLDVLNNVALTVHPGQNFLIITEADVINSYQPIKENLSRSFYAYYLVELINVLTAEEQIHLDVYYLLRETLDSFAENPRRISILAFEIKLLSALGFWNTASVGSQLAGLAHELLTKALAMTAKKQYDEHVVRDLSELVRKQLIQVSEHEFKSPKIIAKLRQQIEEQES